MYTIKLTDGTKIEHLEINGNNYISDTKIDESIFENNLSLLTIINEDDGEETILRNAIVGQQQEWGDGKFYLIFAEKTREQLLNEIIEKYSNNITDIQLALTDIYEMILGGK